jgi:hypothetical protein
MVLGTVRGDVPVRGRVGAEMVASLRGDAAGLSKRTARSTRGHTRKRCRQNVDGPKGHDSKGGFSVWPRAMKN